MAKSETKPTAKPATTPDDGECWFVVTGNDLAALKKADRLVFDLKNGVATVDAIKQYRAVDDPFSDDDEKQLPERKRVIKAGAQPLRGTKKKTARFELNAAKGNQFWRTCLRNVRDEYKLSLKWAAANTEQGDDTFSIIVKRDNKRAKPSFFMLGHGALIG